MALYGGGGIQWLSTNVDILLLVKTINKACTH